MKLFCFLFVILMTVYISSAALSRGKIQLDFVHFFSKIWFNLIQILLSTEEICALPQQMNEKCRALVRSYFHNSVAIKCELFFYTGAVIMKIDSTLKKNASIIKTDERNRFVFQNYHNTAVIGKCFHWNKKKGGSP